MAKPLRPKFLNSREEDFWHKRFDPKRLYSIAEIERDFGLDRSVYRSAVGKLIWNSQHGLLTGQTQDLIHYALVITPIVTKGNNYIIEELVAKRAQQVNWERHRAKYQQK